MCGVWSVRERVGGGCVVQWCSGGVHTSYLGGGTAHSTQHTPSHAQSPVGARSGWRDRGCVAAAAAAAARVVREGLGG